MEFRGMGSHQSSNSGKDEWLTPPSIIKRLGKFDLDPCSPVNRPWDTAVKHYTIEDDGLAQEWEGRVWLNPPYGKHTGTWLKKLADHGDGIALIFARTETAFFFDTVWNRSDAVFFFLNRITFFNVDGSRGKTNAGAPSCLVAYGANNVDAVESSGIRGAFIFNWRPL